MLPRSSCHSAVLLILPSLTTLEMIVPENTPLGKVTLLTSINIKQGLTDFDLRNHTGTMLRMYRSMPSSSTELPEDMEPSS